MAEHTHHPNPMLHVQDEKRMWGLFHDLFEKPISIPLGPTYTVDVPFFGKQTIGLSKFMLLELLAAVLIVVIFVPLARKAARGGLPKGAFWNAFEVLLTFVRNDIARPTIGERDADRFVPFLWTMFLFILFCNLLGMFPFMGSPTASIWMTGAMATISFIMLHGAAIAKMGLGGYAKSLWPHIEIVPNPWSGSHGHDAHGHDHSHHQGHSHTHEEAKPNPTTGEILAWVGGSIFGFILCLMIFTIELGGTFIKCGVLAVRLFANMFGGHMVLATILFFIFSVGRLVLDGQASQAMWGGVTVASVLGMAALSLLELFVAFLQAYVFTLLTSLFMGMALNPQH